jgi:hypothetical protein
MQKIHHMFAWWISYYISDVLFSSIHKKDLHRLLVQV